jgi:hypothetical protein
LKPTVDKVRPFDVLLNKEGNRKAYYAQTTAKAIMPSLIIIVKPTAPSKLHVPNTELTICNVLSRNWVLFFRDINVPYSFSVARLAEAVIREVGRYAKRTEERGKEKHLIITFDSE